MSDRPTFITGFIRFRLYVGDDVIDQQWIDATQPDSDVQVAECAKRQQTLMRSLSAQGKRWIAETWDPSTPGNAYIRWGTDVAYMLDPTPIDSSDDIVNVHPYFHKGQ